MEQKKVKIAADPSYLSHFFVVIHITGADYTFIIFCCHQE